MPEACVQQTDRKPSARSSIVPLIPHSYFIMDDRSFTKLDDRDAETADKLTMNGDLASGDCHDQVKGANGAGIKPLSLAFPRPRSNIAIFRAIGRTWFSLSTS